MNARIARNLLKQDAVYWATPVNDGFGGYTYADPVAVKVAWLDKQEKFIGGNAEELVSRAVVLVDTAMENKGMLALIAFSDLSSSMTPEDNGALEIKAIGNGPDFKGSILIRKVWL